MAGVDDRRSVLIVDDHEPTRLLVGRIVSQELGARVALAGTCEDALRLAEEKAYDVILLDLLMPGIGGYEVLKELRRASANTATPILVVSVLSDRETKELCKAAGADGFLVKPVERRSLLQAVKALLAARGRPRHT